MNRLLTLVITFIFALRLGAQEQNTFRTPDFNFPEEVNTNARAALDKALRVGDSRAAVQALVQISLARTMISRHEVTPAKELIDSVINLNRMTPDYMALLYLIEAEMLKRLDNKWEGDLRSSKIEEWPRLKKDILVDSLMQKSVDPLGNGDYNVLLTPITNYPGIIDPGNEWGQRSIPTLYDFLVIHIDTKRNGKYINQLRQIHAKDKDKFALAYLVSKYGVPGRHKHIRKSDYIYKKFGMSEDSGIFFYYNTPSLKVCKDYLKRYPSSPFSQLVRDYIADYEKKKVTIYYKELLLPTDTIKAEVELSPADTCMLSIYKIPTELYLNNKKFGLKDLTLMETKLVTRNKKLVKKKKKTMVYFDPLPVGYYLLVPAIATPEGFVCDSLFTRDKVGSKLMRVSNLMSFDVTTANSQRLLVLNATDGSPVPEATVQFRPVIQDKTDNDGQALPEDNAQKGNKIICKQTDSNGEVMIDNKEPEYYRVYKGDDYDFDERRTKYNIKKNIDHYEAEIFTDLAIYRPGEEVQLSAVVYYLDTDTMRVLPDSLVTLVLEDSKNDEIDRKELKTNEFGSAAHTFSIPTNLKNGRFLIKAFLGNTQIGSKSFEVSEYKLPTYYIDLSETETFQRKGKRAVVRGRVMTFSGMPVVGAEIEGEIELPWDDDDDDYDDTEFELKTDAEGWFEYKLPRKYSRKRTNFYQRFHVGIMCEDEAGEIQEAETWFNIGTYNLLQLNGRSFLLEDGKTVKLPVIFESTEKDITTAKCSYKLRDKHGKVVAKGTFDSNKAEFDWSNIPSGVYKMSTKINGLKHSYGFTKEIDLYRFTDSKPTRETMLWVPQDLQKVDENGIAHIQVFTSYPCQIYYFATDKHTDVASGWLSCHPGMNKLDIQIPATPHNSLDVAFVTCRNQERFTEKIHLISPVKGSIHLRTVSFRDKITPGEREHWSFRLEDSDGKPLQGSIMLELYSKALENLNSNKWKFQPVLPETQSPRWGSLAYYSHGWYDYTYRKRFSFSDFTNKTASLELYGQQFLHFPKEPKIPHYPKQAPPSDEGKIAFGQKMVNGIVVDQEGEPIIGAAIHEEGTKNATMTDMLGRFSLDLIDPTSTICVNYIGYLTRRIAQPKHELTIILQEDDAVLQEVVVVGYGTQKKSNLTGSIVDIVPGISITRELNEKVANVATRMGDVKVALWRPDLQTDADGNFTLDFDVANDNNTWCLQALAYTKGLATDIFRTEVLAQRPLMVKPVLPRFLRTGDKAQLKAKVENASDSQQQVHVLIELFDPRTERVFAQQQYDLQIGAKGTEVVTIDCPTALNSTFAGFRIKAVNAMGDGDGEQQMIPVQPHTAPVVEALPFFLTPKQARYDIDVPVARPDSTSNFTLEFSDNPTWYCLEALPAMIDDDQLSSNGLAHSLFAIAVADKVRHQCPAELLAADSVQYALLLDTTKLEEQRKSIIEKLTAMQHPSGGLSWMPKGDSRIGASYWSTGVFVELMGDLLQLKCLPEDPALDSLVRRGLQYMDANTIIQAQTDSLAAAKMKFLSYAYIRLMFGSKYEYKNAWVQQRADSIIALTVDAVRHDWKNLPLDERAFAALLLSRSGARKEAMRILESMRQLAVHQPSRGMYWEHMNRHSWFHPVACTAMVLQAYAEIAPKEYAKCIDEIRQWLLLEKQTSHWGNSSMAAHAIHALLLSGDNWLTTSSDVDIRIDGTSVTGTMTDKVKGMIKMSVPTDAKHIEITRKGGHPAWGALFHQYVAPVTEITGDSIEELAIRREFWVKDENDKWKEVPVDSIGQPVFQVGQKIWIRLFIKCDKDLDNLVLTDDRAAFLEPTEHISGYRWSPVIYYQEIKDSCMKFYFERLPEGVHVINYDCTVTHNGHYSCGIASIQSKNAPQYVAHSQGYSVVVK